MHERTQLCRHLGWGDDERGISSSMYGRWKWDLPECYGTLGVCYEFVVGRASKTV